jgi:hypothetical protein
VQSDIGYTALEMQSSEREAKLHHGQIKYEMLAFVLSRLVD